MLLDQWLLLQILLDEWPADLAYITILDQWLILHILLDQWLILHMFLDQWLILHIKVTVQFKTEGRGQNEIFIRMDRSAKKSEKNIVIPHTHNEILKQKNFTGREFEGAPKLLKAFFSKLFL